MLLSFVMTQWSLNPHALRDRVAVVAGATRGAGRGIAAALGEAGATVICTGRSTRATGSVHSDYDRPETIEDTAEDRKSTRLNSSHLGISYAVFCLKKKKSKRSYDLRRLYYSNRV